MSHRTPEEAALAFGEVMQDSLSCLTEARLCYPQAYPLHKTQALVLAQGDPVYVGGDHNVWLSIAHWYLVLEADEGGYTVRTATYYYSIDSDDTGGELFSFQWHPNGKHPMREPHVHVTGIAADRLPTGRVSLEAIVRFMIRDLGVPAVQPDWEDTLDRNELEFYRVRSWA